MIEVTQNKIRMDTVTMTRMMKLLILLTWMIPMTKKMTRMILMTKMMTWRKYDTALSSVAAAGAELNGHLLTRAFLPVIVTVVMMMIISKYFKMFLNTSKYF